MPIIGNHIILPSTINYSLTKNHLYDIDQQAQDWATWAAADWIAIAVAAAELQVRFVLLLLPSEFWVLVIEFLELGLKETLVPSLEFYFQESRFIFIKSLE